MAFPYESRWFRTLRSDCRYLQRVGARHVTSVCNWLYRDVTNVATSYESRLKKKLEVVVQWNTPEMYRMWDTGTVSCRLNTHVDICMDEGSSHCNYSYINIKHREDRKIMMCCICTGDDNYSWNLTFRGPCIVIYSYNESQRDALFIKFIW